MQSKWKFVNSPPRISPVSKQQCFKPINPLKTCIYECTVSLRVSYSDMMFVSVKWSLTSLILYIIKYYSAGRRYAFQIYFNDTWVLPFNVCTKFLFYGTTPGQNGDYSWLVTIFHFIIIQNVHLACVYS